LKSGEGGVAVLNTEGCEDFSYLLGESMKILIYPFIYQGVYEPDLWSPKVFGCSMSYFMGYNTIEEEYKDILMNEFINNDYPISSGLKLIVRPGLN